MMTFHVYHLLRHQYHTHLLQNPTPDAFLHASYLPSVPRPDLFGTCYIWIALPLHIEKGFSHKYPCFISAFGFLQV